MSLEHDQPDDIQHALETAHNPPDAQSTSHAAMGKSEVIAGEGHPSALGQVRFMLGKCGIMAQRYPWQTTAALLVTTGCGWLCGYFGLTVLVALLAYAVTAEE